MEPGSVPRELNHAWIGSSVRQTVAQHFLSPGSTRLYSFDYNPVKDEVNISMIYSTYDTGVARTVPVVIGHSGNQTLDGRVLKHIVDHVIEEECIEAENIPKARY